MKKIGIVSTLDQEWGGSEELWFRVARVCLDHGAEVHCLLYSTLAGNSRFDQFVGTRLHIHIIRSDNAIKSFGLLWRFINKVRKSLDSSYKTRYFANIQFDKLLISQSNTFEYFLNDDYGHLRNKLWPETYLISQFNFEHQYLPPGTFNSIQEPLASMSKTYFVSKRNLRNAERQIASKISNASIIDNPLNLQDFEYVEYPVKNILSFASVARLEVAFKGQDILFEVLSQHQWRSRAWELHLYGSGPDEEYLKSLAVYFNISDKVHFHGHVQNITDIWRNRHVLLLPSIAEGKPLALQEAIVCGRMAVVTDVGGNSELIIDELTGFISPAPTIGLYSLALERAWERREDWNIMGKAAHSWALNNLDLCPEQQIAEAILQ